MGKRKIAILGSTGSIGTQALQVISEHPDIFEVELLTANNNCDLLIEQAIRFDANAVVISNVIHYDKVSEELKPYDIKVFAGNESIIEILSSSTNIDVVLAAMVGFSGLEPTIAAIKSKKTVALANKETLVAAGSIIISLAKQYGCPIIPVDSEHSAIFQALQGERSKIQKIILTASGGPFLNTPISSFNSITKEDALNHPKWRMGSKVSIDSASMMNKGFEMIEAKWLFGVEPSDIEIVVHPQSIIHSMVEFQDGSVIAQMSNPDMKIPIQYSFSYPYRLSINTKKLDLTKIGSLTFIKPDTDKFPCIKIAYEAIERGGNIPCAMNASNEMAVNAFLEGKIKFLSIPRIIEETISKCDFIAQPSLDDIFKTDKSSRETAQVLINNIN